MTSRPPKCSASVTTPSGIDIQALMRGVGVRSFRIAFDPDQFGRPAADIEQDGAASIRIDQRRTTDHRQRRLGLAVDDFKPYAGLGGDAVAKTFRIRGGAAGFGRDQPQPSGLARSILSRQTLKAAIARSIAASLM